MLTHGVGGLSPLHHWRFGLLSRHTLPHSGRAAFFPHSCYSRAVKGSACSVANLQGPRIPRSPRTPAAVSSAGFGAHSPIKPVPSTHSKPRGAKKKGRKPSIHRFRRETETSDIADRPRVARGSCVASGSARLLRPRDPSCSRFLSPSGGFRMPPYPGTVYGVPGTAGWHS